MGISATRYRFTKQSVDNSPDEPGVYALFDGDELIYYGRAVNSIRARLQSHLAGNEGSCTQNATAFAFERCSNPRTREVELLEEYKATRGRLPRCNERVG